MLIYAQLCLYEKYAIIKYLYPENLLNKRSEIISKCPHQRRVLLSNYDTRHSDQDVIDFIIYRNNWFHQRKFLGALKWKCFRKILLLELNNLLFEQFTIYHLSSLLFEQFTVYIILSWKFLTKQNFKYSINSFAWHWF